MFVPVTWDNLRVETYPFLQFQKERMKEFCKKHVFVRESLPSDPPTAKLFYRHLIFEEHTQSMFCFVPKVYIYMCNVMYKQTVYRWHIPWRCAQCTSDFLLKSIFYGSYLIIHIKEANIPFFQWFKVE